MRICLDTNVVLQVFGARARFTAIRLALLTGQLDLVYSNEMLLEYEEAVIRFAGVAHWDRITEFLGASARLHGNILQVSPTFRFGLIVVDPDDNKFVDCAITASVDHLVTDDRHFAPLANSGYRPQPIKPEAFIDRYFHP